MNKNCIKCIKTKSISTTADNFVLEIPDMDLSQCDYLRVCFAQTPPAIDNPPLRVAVSVNDDIFPILETRICGCFCAPSFLYSDQLAQTCAGTVKARQYIDVVFASDSKVFLYVGPCHSLKRPNISFPTISA